MYMHVSRDDLGVETTYLFDVPSVGEDFAVSGRKLVCSQSEHFGDDVRPLPRWRELVAVLGALDASEY
jgi:hypothetical protein